MSIKQFFAASLAIAAAAALPAVEERNTPRCKEVRFQVSGSALNYVIPSTDNLAGLVGATNLTTTTVSGNQTLAGYFCNPNVTNANSTKLQLFRGSFFTNRESWTALGGTPLFNPPLSQYQPQMYSWFDYANALGYPTLAIDTLGDGASSRPDPVAVVQIPYQISIYHDLIQQIRAGTTGQLPSKYSWIAHVSNSLGSTLGNNLAATYPNDIDAYVLTGYSKSVEPSFPGVSLNMPAPAVVVNPTRFAGEPAGYVTSTNETALTNSFFGDPSVVDFDPVVADLFFKRRDVVSLGDVVTIYIPATVRVASQYKGRVLVLTGENDQAYCGLGSSALSPNTMCGPLLKETGTLFPIADYNYQSVPRTGHAIVFHKSVQTTFRIAHDFLAGASYGK